MNTKPTIFEKALEAANVENYLGDFDTVEAIVRAFAQAVLEADDEATLLAEVNRMALIFSGVEQGYTIVPDWHSRLGVGMKACERLNIDPEQSYQDILRSAFADYAAQLLDVLRANHDQPEDVWGWQIDAVVEHCTALLVGIIDTLYPESDADEA
jgi:hypothetical protein